MDSHAAPNSSPTDILSESESEPAVWERKGGQRGRGPRVSVECLASAFLHHGDTGSNNSRLGSGGGMGLQWKERAFCIINLKINSS